jgi:transposase-like protein/predicted RNA-binding protein YlxR (DUF448 family)
MMTSEERQQSGKSWDETRRSALVTQIARAELSVEEACERYGLGPDLIQDWLRGFRRSALLAFDERLKQTLIRQGADSTVLAPAEFSGTLRELSVIDLLQSLHMAGKSAVILVVHDGSESTIWCSGGAVIDAESGRLTGEAALFRIVSFEHGRVLADLRSVTRARTIHAATERLLLESAQRKDEAARWWRKLGDGRRLYRATQQATTSLSSAERSLLESFEPPQSLLDAVGRSEVGDVETLAMLARLITQGCIVADAAIVVATAAAIETADPVASFLPPSRLRGAKRGQATSWQVPRWLWATLGIIVLVAATPPWFRLGSRATQAQAAAPPPPEPSVPAAPVEAPPPYAVVATVEPSNAELWLDGRHAASGQLSILLPRDGRAHELRVFAEGYLPAHLLFVDTPPPVEICLEAIPAAALAAPVATAGKIANERKPVRRTQRGLRPSSATPPRVQPLDPETPKIQVIE